MSPFARQGEGANGGLDDGGASVTLLPSPRCGLRSIGLGIVIPVPRGRVPKGLVRSLGIIIGKPASQSALRHQAVGIILRVDILLLDAAL